MYKHSYVCSGKGKERKDFFPFIKNSFFSEVNIIGILKVCLARIILLRSSMLIVVVHHLSGFSVSYFASKYGFNFQGVGLTLH